LVIAFANKGERALVKPVVGAGARPGPWISTGARCLAQPATFFAHIGNAGRSLPEFSLRPVALLREMTIVVPVRRAACGRVAAEPISVTVVLPGTKAHIQEGRNK